MSQETVDVGTWLLRRSLRKASCLLLEMRQGVWHDVPKCEPRLGQALHVRGIVGPIVTVELVHFTRHRVLRGLPFRGTFGRCPNREMVMRLNLCGPRFTVFSLVMLCATSSLKADFIAMSDFSTNDEGWRLVGDSTTATPTYLSTGGNPGGFVRGFDQVVGGVWFWQAPTKFLGDDSAAYGHTLTYDLRMRGSGPLFDDSDVILSGAGLTLHLDTSPVPSDTSWTSYSVLLSETAGWKVGSFAGPLATQSEVLAVLSNLTSLRIRGEFITGDDNGDLDNVVLNASPVPEPNSLVLASLGILGLVSQRRFWRKYCCGKPD